MIKFVFWFFLSFIFLWYSFGNCVKNNNWYRECSETKKIILNQSSDLSINPEETNIDLSKMDFDDPSECKTDFCYKESEIIVSVKKIWKPMSVVINSTWLKSRDFANNFPNISEKKLINNYSSIYDRYVLQKVLYDRWLMNTKPTWKIWYMTEQAVMALQCIKWIKEYDEKNWIFLIWSKTISEINKLKERMKNSEYLKNTKLPTINLKKCWNEFVERNADLTNLLWNPPSRANNNYWNNISPNYWLDIEGEVKIKKVE